MSRPIKRQSLEVLIHRYLANNGLTVERYIDGRYYRVTQKEFATELADRIYNNKEKIHDLVADRATPPNKKEEL